MNSHDNPILDGLNEHQHEAVTLSRGSALILAGAGSGKTNVLTRRIAWLISQSIGEDEILAVTFTNKAAGEMKRRIKRLLPDVDTRNMWVGTFHGICFRMIAADPVAAGMKPGVTIIDEEDRKVVLRRVMKEIGIPVTGSKEDKERGGGVPIAKAASDIAKWKERGLGPDTNRDSTVEMDRIYVAYEDRLARDNLLDFADLMNRCLMMLETHPEVLEKYAGKYKHILVDEFQDTNDQQFRWLQLLKSPGCHVMAVGDDDQSIYGFRNARPENMNDFLEQIEGCRMIKLERNYRSSQQILDLANAVIERNDGRLGKELWSDKLDGIMPNLGKFESDLSETDYIVNDIAKRIAEGQKPSSIAVVYRTNAQSRLFEKRMVVRNIPHKVFGGQRFYERQEIKNMLAWMQFSQNPDNETALMRIVNFPARGLGDKTLEDIRARAAGNGVSLFAQLLAEGANGNAKAQGFVDIAFKLEEIRLSGTLVDFVRAVAEDTGMNELYANLSDPQEAQERVANMMDMANAALEYQNEAGEKLCEPLLESFLATASLESSTTAEADAQKSSRNAVSLMTVHTAKGLEFQTVYLTGMDQGLFPHAAAIGSGDVPDQDGLEEERRLLYVAITRAMQDLHISYAMRRQINGQTEKTGASMFIREDIPADLVTFNNHAPGMKTEPLAPSRQRATFVPHQRPRRSFR